MAAWAKSGEYMNSYVKDINPDKPLLIVDADEVLLQFVNHLEAFVAQEGYKIELRGYQLTGNIIHTSTNEVATQETVSDLISNFFKACALQMLAVDGAAQSLQRLSDHLDIIILSNVPSFAKADRIQNLHNLGMPYPFIANEGSKGRSVAFLTEHLKAPSFFIDDLPPQHSSVAKHAPDCHRIHFVADPRLGALVSKADHAHHRIDDWDEVHDHITQHING